MKKIFSINNDSSSTHFALLLARVGIAVFMITHGFPKMMKFFSGEPIQFATVFGMSAALSLALVVFAEVFCSLLIFAGMATRLAVIPLIITMLVAVFIIHAADPFAKQEMAALYLLVYGMLLFTGSGKFSIDYLLHRNAKQSVYIKTGNENKSLAA
jgi:putative oxidoreductase